MSILLNWWAHQDLNLGPKDYAYHYSFRCLFPVCSLDCLLSLRPTRTVSTPSQYCYRAWLGITTLRTAQASPNLSSSTCQQSELTCMQPNGKWPWHFCVLGHLLFKSSALTNWAIGPKNWLYFEHFSPQKCRLNFQQSVEAVWKQICNAEAL